MTERPEDQDPSGEVVDFLRKIDARLDRMEGEIAELRTRRRKRSAFASREEREAFFARWEERGRRLQERIAQAEAELAAKRKTA